MGCRCTPPSLSKIPPVLTVLVRAFLAGRAAQAETEKELSALIPSVLDRAFKGEL
jgi:hypothetical protein